jgi:hypothetical protein
VGLPRTGTTSFARAAELLGLRSLRIWHRAEHDPELLARFKMNDLEARRFLAQYHVLSNTPFYALRDTFERYYADTLLVFTIRPRDDWIQSMINKKLAGGTFLANLYGPRGIPWCSTDRDALGQLYDMHHDEVCHGLSSIDLGDTDSHTKRKLLCSALPDGAQALMSVQDLERPYENRFAP